MMTTPTKNTHCTDSRYNMQQLVVETQQQQQKQQPLLMPSTSFRLFINDENDDEEDYNYHKDMENESLSLLTTRPQQKQHVKIKNFENSNPATGYSSSSLIDRNLTFLIL